MRGQIKYMDDYKQMIETLKNKLKRCRTPDKQAIKTAINAIEFLMELEPEVECGDTDTVMEMLSDYYDNCEII